MIPVLYVSFCSKGGITIADPILKKALAETIRRLCTEKNISLSFVEQASGYSQGMFSRWAGANSGEEFSALTKISIIADVLQVSVDTLLDRPPPEPGPPQNDEGGLVRTLTAATRQNKLIWRKVGEEEKGQLGLDQLSTSQSGRAVSGMWLLAQDALHFILATHCDDQDDLDEPLDVGLYAAAGHNLPPYPIQVGGSDLQGLYVCLQIQQIQQTLSGGKSSAD